MALREENLLQDYFHKISLEVEGISESQLNTAIRRGMHGKSKYGKKIRKRYWVTVTAAMAVLLLVATAGSWLNETTGLQNALNPEGKMEIFVPLSSITVSNITLTSAFQVGLFDRIGTSSVEKEGHVLTVDGVVADAMGIIILYSVENNTDESTQLSDLTLEGEDGSEASLPKSITGKNAEPGVTHNAERFTWSKDLADLPEKVDVQLVVSEGTISDSYGPSDQKITELSVPITLNKKTMAKVGQILNVDKPLTVAGQTIDIKQVYVGSTGVYVETSYNQHNTQQIFGMISPGMLLGERDVTGFYYPEQFTRNGKLFNVFKYDNTRPKDPLNLKINGINALEQSKRELVIDTDKQKIIKAPDDALTLLVKKTPENYTMIILKYAASGNKALNLGGNLTLNLKFKDSKGVIHEYDGSKVDLADINNIIKQEADEKEVTNYILYNIGKEKLPQPLTFTLDSYPNPIKDVQTLQIR